MGPLNTDCLTGKTSIRFRKMKRQTKKDQLIVNLSTGQIVLSHPEKYRPIELWPEWGAMQTRLLIRLRNYWTNTRVYWRFYTVVPERFPDMSSHCENTKLQLPNNNGTVFTFADCDDQYIWQSILESMAIIPLARCVFMLDHKPTNTTAAL